MTIHYAPRRVFIQGISGVSAAGDNLSEGYRRLLSGIPPTVPTLPCDHFVQRSNEISPVMRVYRCSAAVEQRLWQLSARPRWLHSDGVQRLFNEAVRGLPLEALSDTERRDCGVFASSSRGVCDLLEDSIAAYYSSRYRPVAGGGDRGQTPLSLKHEAHSPSRSVSPPQGIRSHTSPYTTPVSIAALIAGEYSLSGGQYFVSSACTSSLSALVMAYHCMRGGMMIRAVCGGAEKATTPYVTEILNRAGVTRRDDGTTSYILQSMGKNRRGMVLGDGAGAVLLSTEEKKDSLAEIVGVGVAGEQCGMTGLSPGATFLQAAFLKGLRECRWDAGDVDVLGVHGAGTRKGDGAEIGAMNSLYGSSDSAPAAIISKWATGHALGACGILQLGFCLQAASAQELPITPYSLDPGMAKFVSGPRRTWRNICVWGMGFGGSAVAVFLRLHSGEPSQRAIARSRKTS